MFGSLDNEETTFGTMLQKAGYATAVAGKWQLQGGANGSLAPDCGFDSFCLWNYPGTTRSRFWQPSIMQNGKLLETSKEDYGPDLFTKFIIDFIEEKKDGPFFQENAAAMRAQKYVQSHTLETPLNEGLRESRNMLP